ncbi:SpoIIE family protein phosphatase [Thiorhodovibrio frisius]|uniref:HAMP domain-containing protein,cache domain-containing protein n=1 Tax=Thiorhodovibrio frisius TaxID=631362 RepID=H8Z2P3_9GAMM|nr:SpoIIE family protein phosphatase [Thiorhodovibrio frisius]EIC22736.1 HAMP domain-containing protein,cache domain-containing protein [Thiorhodovibrio frisius]WPL22492.1 Phosphoserine phosphatase RsbU [Thiorhodovibrio frisius]
MISKSLGLKLTVLVLGVSALILGAVLTNTYLFSKHVIVEQAEERSRTLGREAANRIAALIKPVEQAAQNIALAMEDSSLRSEEISLLPQRVVNNNQDLFGMAIAFEPYELSKDKRFFSPYSYRDQDEIKSIMIGGPDENYFELHWYKVCKEKGVPVWSEPYYDTVGSKSLMVTYSVPFYRADKGGTHFAGVVTADITLDWLQEMMSGFKLYQTGYTLILSASGTFIYHPVQQLVSNETIFSLADRLQSEELTEIGRNMIAGKTDFIVRPSFRDKKESFLFYMPLPIGGWSLGFLFPTNEVLTHVHELTRNTLLIGLAGFVVLTLAVLWISRRITQPIRTLSDGALEIAGGNLYATLPSAQSKDEVGQLTDSLNTMQKSLHAYVANLEQTTIHKERIESELRIARDIQMGILPKLFPAFSEYEEFDIFASLKSAKEVGGDLYDFFFIDPHHVCFNIGDVSGKGVPAAFFMAITKTLIKVMAERDSDPHRIIEKVNNDLAEDNESCMFVTLFLAILDIRTGQVSYCCAGHNPPILRQAGVTTYLKTMGEPIAGALPDIEYTTQYLTLAPGDTIFLYTDGVTEAMNINDELYSDARLLNFMTQVETQNAADIIEPYHYP